MAELPPEMARLLEDARRAHEPSAADCERVRRGLYTALGAQAALGHAGAAKGAAGSGSSGALSALAGTTGGKVLLVAALMGGAGGVWTWSARSAREPAVTSSAREPMVTSSAPVVPAITVSQLSPVEPAPPQVHKAERAAATMGEPTAPALETPSERPVARALRSAQEPRAVRTPRARQRESAPDPSAGPARASQPIAGATAGASDTPRTAEHVTSTRVPAATEVPRAIVKEESEVTLIRAAFASLNAHEPQRTLELLDAHAARYPIGAMGRERAGLRVLALCDVGRVQEGRREQAAFLQTASDSPLQNRVRRACASSAETSERDGREPQ